MFITNTAPSEQKYKAWKAAAKKFGIVCWFEDTAYDVFGNKVPSLVSFHVSGDTVDLSDFWKEVE